MMEIKGWTQKEIEYLRKNYTKYTCKELATRMSKTESSIKHAANKMKLVKQPHNSWSEQDLAYLKDNYLRMTAEQMAKELKRGVISVRAKLSDLNCSKEPNWTKEEETFLIENYSNMLYAEIGKVLNKTEQAVRAKCFDMDLYKQDPPWNKKDLDFLIENYPYMCTKEIAELLGRTVNSVVLKANRNGITKFPYYCNYHFFDVIDSEEKAYWLGFLMADGWISKKKDNTGKVTGVELQYRDVSHLRKLNNSLRGNYKITDRWRKCSLSRSDKENHSCVLRIYSSVLHDTLINYGFTYCKSFDASIPLLDPELLRHFVRGYFDGNGSICLSRNILRVSFCTASAALKDDLVQLLLGAGIEMKDYSYVDNYGVRVYVPEATSNKNKYAVLDYMYQGATIYLDRKYKKYLKAKEYAELNESLTS